LPHTRLFDKFANDGGTSEWNWMGVRLGEHLKFIYGNFVKLRDVGTRRGRQT